MTYAGFYFTRKVFGIVKGPVKEILQINDFQSSHIWTAFLISYMFGQFFSAWCSTRIRKRTQLLIGMCVSLLCTIAAGFLFEVGPSAYWPIVLVFAIHGVAQATGWPCTVGLMANWTRHSERGTVMALWGTCYQLGSIAAKAFAGAMFVFGGLLWSFWAPGLILAVVIVIFYFWGRETPEEHGIIFDDDDEASVAARTHNDETGTSAPASPALALSPDQQARRRNRLIIAMGLIYFGFKFLRYAIDSWGPLIVTEHFGRSTAYAAVLTTSYDWLGFLGVIVAGWASDRFFNASRSPVIFYMTCGSLLGAILLWQIGLSSLLAFILLLGFLGFMTMGPDSLLVGAGAVDVGSRAEAAKAALSTGWALSALSCKKQPSAMSRQCTAWTG